MTDYQIEIDAEPVTGRGGDVPVTFPKIFRAKIRGRKLIDVTVNSIGICHPDAVVLVSICEVDANDFPFQGNASMEVHNIVPLEGKVKVRVTIHWDTDLNARLNILVWPQQVPD